MAAKKPGAAAPPHLLYVGIAAPGATDDRSVTIRKNTLDVLKYVEAQKPTLAAMGITFKVTRLEPQHLADAKMKAALKNKGITGLPALRAVGRSFVGAAAIKAVYNKNIQEYESSRSERQSARDDPDNELDEMYRREMTSARAREDMEDHDEIGDSKEMMNSFQRQVERRERSRTGRRPGQAPAPRPAPRQEAEPGLDADDEQADFHAERAREDNIPDEDDEISRIISRVDGHGPELDDDPGSGDMDAKMEQAMWSNHVGGD